LETIDVLDS